MTDEARKNPGAFAQLDNDTARQAERLWRDTRFDWLRPRGRRRALVGLTILWLAVIAAACLADHALLVVLALVPGWGLWWVFQRVVRGMADLPDAYVDERMRSVRNAHYRTAYVVFAGLTVLALLVLYLAADARHVAWRAEARHLHAIFWVLHLTAMMLPSWVVAWNEEYL